MSAQTPTSESHCKVEVGATAVALGAILKATVTTTTDRATPPSMRFPNQRVLRRVGFSRQTRQEVVYLSGGQTAIRHVWIYQILWKPRKIGTYTLSVAERKTGRNWLRCSAITLAIHSQDQAEKKSSSQPESEDFSQIRPRGAIFLHPVLSQVQAVWGQQVTLSYYLFIQHAENIGHFQPPPLVDFDYETLHHSRSMQFHQAIVLQGIRYRYALAVRYAIFPKKTGKLRIPPMSVSIQQVNGQERRLYSPVIELRVEALPASPQPNLSAYTGQYRWYVPRPGPQTWVRFAPVPWQICVQGVGNIRQVRWKPPRWPVGLRSLYQRQETRLTPNSSQVQGTTCQTWYLRPQEVGTWMIPSIRLQQYDPWQQQFSVIASEAQSVRVLPSPVGVPNTNPAVTETPQTSPMLPRDVGAVPTPIHRSPSNAPSAIWWKIGIGLAGFVFLLAVAWRWRKKTDHPPTQHPEDSHQLSEQIDHLQRWLAHYSRDSHLSADALREVEQALLRWIDEYLVSLSSDYALRRSRPWHETKPLLQQHLHRDMVEEFGHLLQLIQTQRFAPQPESLSVQQILVPLQQLLAKLSRIAP